MVTNLWGVQPHELPAAWPKVEAMITAALERGSTGLNASNVYSDLESGSKQLWAVWGEGGVLCSVVTDIQTRPKDKVMRIIICTGEGANSWVHHLKTLEKWAKMEHNCASVLAWARPGWSRVLKDYTMTHVMLEKGLGDEH